MGADRQLLTSAGGRLKDTQKSARLENRDQFVRHAPQIFGLGRVAAEILNHAFGDLFDAVDAFVSGMNVHFDLPSSGPVSRTLRKL